MDFHYYYLINTTHFLPGLTRIQKTIRSLRSDKARKLGEGARNTEYVQDGIEDSKNSASFSANADGESLEDLIRNLHRQIKDSDWLQENTAEKLAAENPELAKAFLHQDTNCTKK